MFNIKILKKLGSAFLFPLVLGGCLPLMDDNDANRFNDFIAPRIIIESPQEKTNCANIEEVTGRVTDLAAKNGAEGQVRSLTFRVDGSMESGKADLLPDKRFSFRFETDDLNNDFVLLLTATDWNDNQTTLSYRLSRNPDNGIPSFTVKPGNKMVELSWANIPDTDSYTLYYTKNESLPSTENGITLPKVLPLTTISPLENGRIHTFRLIASPQPGTDWPVSKSDYITALPLAPTTLAPQVKAGYKKITISWNKLPEVKHFEIRRSDRKDTGFDNVLTTVSDGTSFPDEDVKDGQWYYYKVYPAAPYPIASAANGAEPGRIPEKLYLSRTISPFREATDIAVSGHYAYLLTCSDGLHIIDIASQNPASTISPVYLNGEAHDLAISGNYAYVAAGGDGLIVVDISNPEAAKVVRTVTNIGVATNVEIAGNYAYVSIESEPRLRVIDIQYPPEAGFKQNIELKGTADKVSIRGHYAYVSSAGLRIFDMISPVDWHQIYEQTGVVNDITVDGSYAYLVYSTKDFQILDITNPAAPGEVTKFKLTKAVSMQLHPWNSKIVVSGAYAYVTDNDFGLYCISLHNPGEAKVVASKPTPDSAMNLAVVGSTVYIADWTDMQIIDTGHLYAPEYTGTILHNDGVISRVVIDGSYAYVAISKGGLWVVNVNNRMEAPHKVPDINTAMDVVVSGNYAYVAAETDGLKIVDISDPPNAHVTGNDTRGITGSATAVAVAGDYAYVSAGSSFQVMDISDPAAVSLAGTAPKIGTVTNGIKLSGNYAYLAKGLEGLVIVDIQDPHHPDPCKTVDTGEYTSGLDIEGTMAYVTTDHHGLQIVDISKPPAAQIINTVWTAEYTANVICAGSYAIVMNGGSRGVKIVDISNAWQAQVVGSLFSSEVISRGAVSGNHLYLVSEYGNLKDILLFP